MILLSGGKDSTYAVAKMAEITRNMLCVTLDNGDIAQEAKTNISRITKALGLDHRFLTTPAINEIFVDNLKRHSNVCQGCFKTIYTLALDVARAVGAPMIVTGLSRGQLLRPTSHRSCLATRRAAGQRLLTSCWRPGAPITPTPMRSASG